MTLRLLLLAGLHFDGRAVEELVLFSSLCSSPSVQQHWIVVSVYKREGVDNEGNREKRKKDTSALTMKLRAPRKMKVVKNMIPFCNCHREENLDFLKFF